MGGMLWQKARFAFVLLFFVGVPIDYLPAKLTSDNVHCLYHFVRIAARSEARFKICDTIIKSCFRRVCSQKSKGFTFNKTFFHAWWVARGNRFWIFLLISGDIRERINYFFRLRHRHRWPLTRQAVLLGEEQRPDARERRKSSLSQIDSCSLLLLTAYSSAVIENKFEPISFTRSLCSFAANEPLFLWFRFEYHGLFTYHRFPFPSIESVLSAQF